MKKVSKALALYGSLLSIFLIRVGFSGEWFSTTNVVLVWPAPISRSKKCVRFRTTDEEPTVCLISRLCNLLKQVSMEAEARRCQIESKFCQIPASVITSKTIVCTQWLYFRVNQHTAEPATQMHTEEKGRPR